MQLNIVAKPAQAQATHINLSRGSDDEETEPTTEPVI